MDKKTQPGYFLFLIRPKIYETDLTDFQCQVNQEILPDTGRRKHSLRLIVNALLYWTKSDCQWRLLAREFPAYALICYYFRRWQADGRWAQLNQALVRRHRQRAAPPRQSSPSVAVLDAQSINSPRAHWQWRGW